MSNYRAHKQDMTGRPGGGEPGSGAGGAREGLVLTAQEAGLVEAAAFALHLLGEVHRFLADAALLSSSPVWHPAEKARAGMVSGREVRQEAGTGQSRAAGAGARQQPFHICTCGAHPRMLAVGTDSPGW